MPDEKKRVHHSLLRDERLRRKWSQQYLAECLETTKLTVRRWEQGVTVPSPYFRVKLTALLGKSFEELGFGSKEFQREEETIPGPDADISSSDQPDVQLSQRATDIDMFPQESSRPRIDAQTIPPLEIPVNKIDMPFPQTKKSDQKHHALRIFRKYKFGLPGLLVFICITLLIHGSTLMLSPQEITQTPNAHKISTMPPDVPGQVLYEAQWTQGLDRWSLSKNCTWSNNSGGKISTNGYNNDLLIAPYTLNLSDYTIEASIQRTGYTTVGGEAYGLFVRNSSMTGGYIAGVGIHFVPEHFFLGVLTPSGNNEPEYVSTDLVDGYPQVPLDTQWHTYRMDVSGSTLQFSVDGKKVAEAKNNLYTQAGNVGIYVNGAILAIRSFKIVTTSITVN